MSDGDRQAVASRDALARARSTRHPPRCRLRCEGRTALLPMRPVCNSAIIGHGVSIGPYCIVGPHVEIADGCTLHPHVHVTGRTRIGARTVIYPFVSAGTPPQSVHYHGEPTRLEIGADCDIREGVTINIGTVAHGVTTVGDRCFLMAGSHVAHDCIVGSNVTFANGASLGGHCEVGDYVFFGGQCAVHQFTRIGESAMIGGLSGVRGDIVPFGLVSGYPARLDAHALRRERRAFERTARQGRGAVRGFRARRKSGRVSARGRPAPALLAARSHGGVNARGRRRPPSART
jgi:UDP-N-acetylglucosamine acyltransferase